LWSRRIGKQEGRYLVEIRKLSAPKVKGYDRAYELSYQLASERLAGNADIMAQCRKAGAEYDVAGSRPSIVLTFLGRRHRITLPEIEVTLADAAEPVVLRDKLLVLHYLNTATGAPPTGRRVTFRELPAGPVYFPTFAKRAIRPIVDAFGKDPARLLAAAAKIGNIQSDLGDAGVTIDAFPRVPIAYVLWAGDDELPPQGNILFDSNVSDYLPTEDITVLTESITWRLVRSPG
jgi:hypothetical protein